MRTWGLLLSLTPFSLNRIWYCGLTFTMRDWLKICHNKEEDLKLLSPPFFSNPLGDLSVSVDISIIVLSEDDGTLSLTSGLSKKKFSIQEIANYHI